jgi:hypothetical protein
VKLVVAGISAPWERRPVSGRRALRRPRWAHRASSIIEQEESVMKIEYRCHAHGVIVRGETDDLGAERPETCPEPDGNGSVCGATIFVALIHAP